MGMFDSITDAVSDIGSSVAPYAGLIGGAVGGPQGYALGSMLGGALGGNSQQAQSGVSALGGYLNNQAAQRGNINATQASQFRPVGITNTFGTSNFGYDPTTGQLTSAGYTLSPQLQAAQNTLMSNQAQNLQDVANVQNLGRQYIAQSPQEAAKQYMANQQALLQPSRDLAQARLNTNLFNSGTGGLSVAQGGNLGMANPEQQALANAQALQDLQLAAQAQQAGQQQVQFGQGLLSSAYQPYNAGLSALGATEGLGQQPLELSASLAGRSATAGNNAAKYIQGSSVSPTGQLLGGAGMSALLGQGISSLFGNNVPAWTTGADVMPTSTFSGWGNDYSGFGDNAFLSSIGL